MIPQSQEQLEREIVRMLDNELSKDEEASLLREVLRDPQAHAIMSDYRRNDELAREALQASLFGNPSSQVARQSASAVGATRPVSRDVLWSFKRVAEVAAVACAALVVGAVAIVTLNQNLATQTNPGQSLADQTTPDKITPDSSLTSRKTTSDPSNVMALAASGDESSLTSSRVSASTDVDEPAYIGILDSQSNTLFLIADSPDDSQEPLVVEEF